MKTDDLSLKYCELTVRNSTQYRSFKVTLDCIIHDEKTPSSFARRIGWLGVVKGGRGVNLHGKPCSMKVMLEITS